MFESEKPLAERLRPVAFDDFCGQQHLVGAEGIIRKAVESGIIPSMIFWGPPGVGKTSLANVIANQVKASFHNLSAISAGVKDVREIIAKAKYEKDSIVFIDEIHRFSKSQQDSLLEAVEKGWVTLIGATTENPSFEVISALLSRCQVYTLNAFRKADLEALLQRALKEDATLSKLKIELERTKDYQRIFYLSTPSSAFGEICNCLKDTELIQPNSKVVLEKPLGNSLATSQEIHAQVGKCFKEEQRGYENYHCRRKDKNNILII